MTVTEMPVRQLLEGLPPPQDIPCDVCDTPPSMAVRDMWLCEPCIVALAALIATGNA